MRAEGKDFAENTQREDVRESIGMLLDLEQGTPGVLAEGLLEFHPVEIAEVLSDFDDRDASRILAALPAEIAAETLTEIDPVTREKILDETPEQQISELVETLPPDEGADILDLLSDSERREVLDSLEPEQARELERLEKYDPESAGGLMTTRFVAVKKVTTVEEALAQVRGNTELETFHYVYVVDDEGHLGGVVTARAMVASPGATSVADIMETDVVSVRTKEDQETVASLVRKYNLTALPVVDDADRLVGMVTVDDIIDVIDEEFSEDIFRLAGTYATHPTREPVWRRILLRLPWLVVTLAGGLVVALVGKKFEARLEAIVTVFLFWPAINAMGGNVGIQSSTIVVRGLATGEVLFSRLFKVLFGEIRVGAAIGFFFGILSMGLVYVAGPLIVGDANGPDPLLLGVAVGISMMVGVVASALVGTLVPMLCWRIGIDPAITAGPFVTVLNDIFCTSIYFTVATLILLKTAPG